MRKPSRGKRACDNAGPSQNACKVINASHSAAEGLPETEPISSEGNSSDGLDIDTSAVEKPPAALEYNDKLVLDNIEEEIGRQLNEKVAKSNLTASNVKNILKHVITNEQVLAMVRQTVEESENNSFFYEPKLTRAKAKQLFQNSAPPPWMQSNHEVSETRILIEKDLPEDSSDDEYKPAEEESEEESSVASDLDSQPSTPSSQEKTNSDISVQTSWTEDGVFKIPPLVKEKKTETENIARRTRSKLCLSDTPLEVIEEAFVPPDITTDMYDLECDDEDWKDFLTNFTRPLEEAVKEVPHEEDDDETDPEYNVLADIEVDRVDREELKEELRADKAVKVTRKELNSLMAELFDFQDLFESKSPQSEAVIAAAIASSQNEQIVDNVLLANSSDVVEPIQRMEYSSIFSPDQKALLDQQMRQHVQILTQNYLQTYKHPDLGHHAAICKEYLYSLKYLGEGKMYSSFHVHNLEAALSLISKWERNDESELFNKNYNPTDPLQPLANKFSATFLQTVINSEVFIYPNLLPTAPFYKQSITSNFCPSETQLIAIGVEQYLESIESECATKKRKGNMRVLSHTLSKYLMPAKKPIQIYGYIRKMKTYRQPYNAIRHTFLNNAAPFTSHLVVPLEIQGVIQPVLRNRADLPPAWANYLYPLEEPPAKIFSGTLDNMEVTVTRISGNTYLFTDFKRVSEKRKRAKKSIQKVSRPPPFNERPSQRKDRLKSPTSQLRSPEERQEAPLTAEALSAEPTTASEAEEPTDAPSSSNDSQDCAMPSMPKLCAIMETINQKPGENSVQQEQSEAAETAPDSAQDEGKDKEYEDELNGSSNTNMPKGKKGNVTPRHDVKKLKQKKDLASTISVLVPEDTPATQAKLSNYAMAYMDKVQERLGSNSTVDYDSFVEMLTEFYESTNSVSDLFRKLANVFGPNNADLGDEFLTFLTPQQAREIGRLVPHFMYDNMVMFLRKVEVYFARHPSQVKKIYNALQDLATRPNVTMDEVKASILPLLRGCQLLMDWFLQIFPEEPPPASRMARWEELRNEDLEASDDFELVEVPDVEDPYGGPNCICACHKVDDAAFRSRVRHCIPCGTKYIQGSVYVQTGRGLRPAHVIFDDGSGVDQFKRLNSKINAMIRQKRKSETLSPIKSKQQLHEEDAGKAAGEVYAAEEAADTSKSSKKQSPSYKKAPSTSRGTKSEGKQPAETSPGKASPSKRVKLSQDDTENWAEDLEEMDMDHWTRDEDQIILETVKEEDEDDATFRKIAERLPGRSYEDVKERFQCLLQLIEEIF